MAAWEYNDIEIVISTTLCMKISSHTIEPYYPYFTMGIKWSSVDFLVKKEILEVPKKGW